MVQKFRNLAAAPNANPRRMAHTRVAPGDVRAPLNKPGSTARVPIEQKMLPEIGHNVVSRVRS